MLENIIAIWQKYDFVFIQGLKVTLVLSLITVFFGTILGCMLAFLKLSKIKILNVIAVIYIEILRGTPILLQLYFFWLFLPKALSFNISETACIVIALVVNSSSYIAEIIRAGIQGVDKGQTEAAKSLGLSNINAMRYVIMPQAIKNILPALGNQFIMMLKETSLASVFFVGELMTSFKTVQSSTFLAIPPLVIVGIIYLIITITLTQVVNTFERRLKQSDK